MTALPPVAWERATDRSDRWRAEVRADNVVLLELTVHEDGTGCFGRGRLWWCEGLDCGMGNSAPDLEAGKAAAITCAREMLLEGIERLDASTPAAREGAGS